MNSQREIRTNNWERSITKKRVYGGTKKDTRCATTAKEEAFKAYQKDKIEEHHCGTRKPIKPPRKQ